MTVLALDLGSKRIGVAVALPGTTLAMPLEPIVRTNLRNDLAALVALLTERECRTVVIGDPLTLSGQRGPAAETADAFVAKLAAIWDGEIVRIDERLTTAQSTKTLLNADVSRAKRRNLVDGIAASLILEQYLARQRRGG